MNNRDREIIFRIERILAVPEPKTASTSTTIRGLSGYHADVTLAIGHARRALRQLSSGELYQGSITEDLHEAEEWFARRSDEEWT